MTKPTYDKMFEIHFEELHAKLERMNDKLTDFFLADINIENCPDQELPPVESYE